MRSFKALKNSAVVASIKDIFGNGAESNLERHTHKHAFELPEFLHFAYAAIHFK